MSPAVGHRLGEAAQTESWRCPICTLVNAFHRESCARCTEPLDEEEREENRVRGKSSHKIGGGRRAPVPEAGASRDPPAPAPQKARRSVWDSKKARAPRDPPAPAPRKARAAPTVPAKKSRAAASEARNLPPKASGSSARPARQGRKSGRGYRRTGALSPLKPSRSGSSSARSSGNSSGQTGKRRGASISTFGKKTGEVRQTRMKKDRLAKKSSGRDFKKMSDKQLGYKAKKRGNMNRPVKSRLHQDTAAYRGKFESKPLGGAKGNIATVGDLTSKSGWQTSIDYKKKPQQEKKKRSSRAPVARPKHEWAERSFPKPKDYNPTGAPKSTIMKLQGMCSNDAVASLKCRLPDKAPKAKKTGGNVHSFSGKGHSLV